MKWKQILLVMSISAITSVASVWSYNKFFVKKDLVASSQSVGKMPANYAGFFEGKDGAGDPVDFTKASAAAVPAVAHIKSKFPARRVSNELPNRQRGNQMDDFFDQFFNFGPTVIPEQRASGSGVIISEDGYLVTNNHVISDEQTGKVADEITVTLSNKKVYKARVIGKDPSSDLAVLKIDGTGLPYMIYGNSDDVKLGQWVLAVGYPLTLETTVTAGIVSAKARSIGINSRQSQTPVESFIQTDAAVNQGNSGGALINTTGQLIGINSAILAPNGTYAGYSFAIPVNIVKKVVNDLIEFGDVKRGFLGISYAPQDEENERLIKQAGIKEGQGVYVQAVPADGAAAKAGLKKGDVITKVNNSVVSSGIELSGHIASFKPGEKVPITYVRGGSEKSVDIVLKEGPGKLEVLSASNISDKLGADLENLDKKKAEQYEIDGGVVVKKIHAGGAMGKTRIAESFIITGVNGRPIKNIEELSALLGNVTGTVRLEGMYPGSDGTYTYPLTIDVE
jgi:Do/DeqQ family serine protease